MTPASTTINNIKTISMRSAVCSVAVLAVLLYAGPAHGQKDTYFYNVPGDYCRTRDDPCCLNRQDDCSVPISGTRCYCDEFCNRDNNPDCCPDYPTVCLGVVPPPISTPKPPEPQIQKCPHNHHLHDPGTTFHDNCNSCTCTEKGRLVCSDKKCLVDTVLLDQLPSDHWSASTSDQSWLATNYSMFWGKELAYGMLHRTGTHDSITQLNPIRLTYDRDDIPIEFDARTKWPNWISRPRDQGWCGSSWAFSTISVASDRLAIGSHGHEAIMLSPQNLISCDRWSQQGCDGGSLERAWFYLRRDGVVDEECYPYTSQSSSNIEPCKLSSHEDFSTIPCIVSNEISERREMLFRAEPAYRIASKESDIQYEIMRSGPVQAKMRVEQDFFYYRAGVYSSSGRSDPYVVGTHSVRLIGWGEEISNYGGETLKYWLAANSWGEDWGEEGLFRIRRGTNESGIEEQILSVRMKLLIRYDPLFHPGPSKWFY